MAVFRPSGLPRPSEGVAIAMALRDSGDLDRALGAIQESRKIQEQSLNRPAEAVQPLEKAFVIAEELANKDPYDNHDRVL